MTRIEDSADRPTQLLSLTNASAAYTSFFFSHRPSHAHISNFAPMSPRQPSYLESKFAFAARLPWERFICQQHRLFINALKGNFWKRTRLTRMCIRAKTLAPCADISQETPLSSCCLFRTLNSKKRKSIFLLRRTSHGKAILVKQAWLLEQTNFMSKSHVVWNIVRFPALAR